MRLPDDVFASVVAERAKFGAVPTPTELGILLNRVAWTHRDHKNGKFGVSRKVGGVVVPFPGGGTIAQDVLMLPHGPYWDVLDRAGADAAPVQGESGIITDPRRYWVAPVDPMPTDTPGPEPTDPVPEPTEPPAPSAEIAALTARIEALEGRCAQLIRETAAFVSVVEAALANADPSQWEAAGTVGWWGVTLPLRRR